MGPPQQATRAPRWRLAALVVLTSAGRCDAGMFDSVCKMTGTTSLCKMTGLMSSSSSGGSSACTSASCCQKSSCYFAGMAPGTKCNADRGPTSCSSMTGKGYCMCTGGASCATGTCASSRLLEDEVRLWELDDHDDDRVSPEDHTVGLMTYGLIVAATAGLGVKWTLGGRQGRGRTRSAGLLESGAGEGLELQGLDAAEE